MSSEQEGVRERAADEIAGVSIGSGYYETSVGTGEARECARLALASLGHPETVAGLAEVLGEHEFAGNADAVALCACGIAGMVDALDQARPWHARHLSAVALRWLAGGAS